MRQRASGRFVSSLVVLLASGWLVLAALCADEQAIIRVDEIRPGMKGEARTIFSGQQVESFEVEVLGVLRNFFGPQQDIILVRLAGPRVEYTGVVAGMSGSPVYLEGRLAGALSLRFGAFTREPIAGVTPIASMLQVGQPSDSPTPVPADAPSTFRYPLPEPAAASLGFSAGSQLYLVPIETPLAFSGFYPQAIAHFADELARYGLLAVPGGSMAGTAAQTSRLEPGGAVSAALVTGDLSVAGTCTVTLREGDRLYACGHPVLAQGAVEMPMAEAEIVTTVASGMASFKIANVGQVIGTFTQDRRTAIVGVLGRQPRMIPVELTLVQPRRAGGAAGERRFRVQLFQHPTLSPLLLGLAIANALVGTPEYGEQTSYRVAGRIELRQHAALQVEDMFSATDTLLPDALVIANRITQAFQRVFANPFEQPEVEGVRVRLEMIPERRSATIENAWSDKSEVVPGETLTLKVVLQPYRAPRRLVEVPVEIPPNVSKGNLRILISDATLLDRVTRAWTFDPRFAFAIGPRLSSLDQLITQLNRERRNDRLYIALFQPNPTLLVQDKVLPSVPLSQLNVLGNSTGAGQPAGTMAFYESLLSEISQPLDHVVSGGHWLAVRVR